MTINSYKNDWKWLLQNRNPSYYLVIMLNPAEMPISRREHQVLQLLALGKKSKDIGLQLEISVHTVSNHRKSLLKKSGASNVTELIIWGHKIGLL